MAPLPDLSLAAGERRPDQTRLRPAPVRLAVPVEADHQVHGGPAPAPVGGRDHRHTHVRHRPSPVNGLVLPFLGISVKKDNFFSSLLLKT